MMRTTTQDTEFIFEQREDANGDIVGTGTGRAVPYGVEIEIGGVRESFARDAFNVDDVIGKPLAYRHNEPVGIITGAENREDGLYIDFDIVNTTLGRDAATLARTGASRGLSVGFNPIKSAWTKTRDAVQHMSAGLLEVSLTPYPAYATAGVSAIREDEGVPMSETIVETEVVSVDTEAREAIAQVRETVASIEARAFTAEPVHPLAAYRSFGEYSKAVLSGEIESRALADQITANNAGVLPPNWILDVKNIVDLGRPTVSAFGVESAGASGMEFAWPYFDGDLALIVEEQLTEKTEVNSVRIDIKKGTASLKTYAAGSDISYQLLQRSSPSYLDAHNRIMAASYALMTDNAFVAGVYGARTPLNYVIGSDTDGSGFREAVFAASIDVQTATGTPAEFVIVSPDVYKTIGGWSTFFPSNYGVQNVSGIASANTLAVNVSGLPVILDRNFGGNAIIVSNREAAKWIEDGPNLATAENVANLGRDVAIYGYGVSAIYTPAGVIGLETVSP
jgi:HK97 family phage prohead protease